MTRPTQRTLKFLRDGEEMPRFPDWQGIEFRHIPGFIGYAASSDGRVWTCRRRYETKRTRTSAYIPCWVPKGMSNGPDGYLNTGLVVGDKLITKTVHILIALAFIGTRPDGKEVCHNDGNKRNNRSENLRYDTAKANKADMYKHGTGPIGEKHARAKLSASKVAAIRNQPSVSEAKKLSAVFGVSESAICHVWYRRVWRHVV